MVRDQIGLAHSDRGDWAAAVEEQRESVRRFPGLAVAHKALAHALEGAGRLDDAVAEFREAVRLEPRFPSAYLYLGRALIEAGEYRAALEALARVAPGPPPADPKLGPSTLISRAEHLLALEPRLLAVVEGCDRPADAEAMRGIRPDRLLPALLRGGGPPVGRRVRRLADAGGRPDHGEPLPGRTSRGAGRCRERPTRRRVRRPLPGAMARAGRGLAGSRPRRVRRRPGVGDSPAASRGFEATRPVAGQPGPVGNSRCTRPGRDPRARAPFAPRPLAPDRCVTGEGRRPYPARTRRGQKPVRTPVTSGDIFPI